MHVHEHEKREKKEVERIELGMKKKTKTNICSSNDDQKPAIFKQNTHTAKVIYTLPLRVQSPRTYTSKHKEGKKLQQQQQQQLQ